MSPSYDAAGYGLVSGASRSPRRRRVTAIIAVLSIAAAGALIGRLSHTINAPQRVTGGPFVYFPG